MGWDQQGTIRGPQGPEGTGSGSGVVPAGLHAVAYGDSITDANQYQLYVTSRLALASYAERGHGGRTIVSHLSTILGFNDHATFGLCTFMFGTNDKASHIPIGTVGAWADTPPTNTFLGAYRTAIDHILAQNPTIRIVLCTPLSNNTGFTTNSAGHTMADYADAVKTLGQMYALPVCDVHGQSGFNPRTYSTLTTDGVHPSTSGYQRLGRFIGDFIASVYGGVTPAGADTTKPTWSTTFTLGAPAETSMTVTASAMASDDVGVSGYERTLNGTTWASIVPSGNTFTLTGLTAETTYSTVALRARDASGNRSDPVTVPNFTTAAPAPPDTTPPTWSATLTTGTPTQTSVPVTATALATDNVAVVGYEQSTNSGGTWAAITPAGTTFTVTGLTPGTGYPAPQFRARDAAGNTSTPALTAQPFTTATPPVTATLADAIMALSPTGYWKLNETSGTTATDSSGNGHHGTYSSAYTLANKNGFVRFADGGVVTIPTSLQFQGDAGLTMFLIASPDSTAIFRRIIWHERNWQTIQENNKFASGYLATADWATGRVDTTDTFPLETWTGFASTAPPRAAGATPTHYVGSSNAVATEPKDTAKTPTQNTGYPVRIGTQFRGGVGHVAVFRKQLTAQEVGGLMTAARTEGLIP